MSVSEKYLKGSVVGIAGKASRIAGGYGTLWFLTHILSSAGYGGYVTMLAVASLVSLVAQLGLRQATIQRVSELSMDDPSDIERYVGAATAWALVTGSVGTVLLWVAAGFVGDVADERLVSWARLLAVVVPGMTLKPIFDGVLRGYERVSEAIAYAEILPQLLRLALLVFTWLFVQNQVAVVAAVAASYYLPVVFLGAVTGAWQSLNFRGMSAEHLEYSGYLLVNSIGSQFLKRTDVLLLTLLVTLKSTGGYNVAWKVAAVAQYGDQVLTNVLQPRLSKFIETGEIGTLLREFGQVRDLGVVASLPVLVLVVLFGEQILGIFGDYSAQYPVLVVLAVGAVVNSSFGSVGQILIMGKRGRLVLLNTLVNVVGNVSLGFVLIPRFETMGAAVATVLTVYLLTNLLGALEVKYFMGIDTFDYLSLGGTGVVGVVVIARVVGVLSNDLVLVVVVALVAAALLNRRATYLRELLSAAIS